MIDLKEIIAQISKKIKQYHSLYEKNESAVRVQIIEPILKSLGWDTENPEEVLPEVSAEEGIPDYTLYLKGEKFLFIEAKKLSVDINQKKPISQLAKYCVGEGLLYGILTNGVVWLLFKSFQEGTTILDRKVWLINIENDNPTKIARKLDTISKQKIGDIKHLLEKLDVLDKTWESILKNPDEIVKGLIPTMRSLIRRDYPDYQFEDSEIEYLLTERFKEIISTSPENDLSDVVVKSLTVNGDKPRKMTLQNEKFELHNSFEILVNTANWLIKRGKIKQSVCPINIVGGKRYLINAVSKHRDGAGFRAPKKLTNGLFIETSLSTTGAIDHSRRLLEKFGFPANILIME